MLFNTRIEEQPPLWAALTAHYRQNETACLKALSSSIAFSSEEVGIIQAQARTWIERLRLNTDNNNGINAFMHQYSLSTEEGLALMCLAEALLRIPDKQNRDKLIKDKLMGASWHKHMGSSHSTFVNATTWGLMLTGQVYQWTDVSEQTGWHILKRLVSKTSEPFMRQAVTYVMKILGDQFVMGQTIEKGLIRAQGSEAKGYRYSYDMLGEAAKTAADAEKYYLSYAQAIKAIGEVAKGRGPVNGPGISIKLSALYPRYEWAKKEEVMAVLLPKLIKLALQAKQYDLGMTIDAEEAERLELSLHLIDALFMAPELTGWNGLGLAVQAYQKRAFWVIDWLGDLAKRSGHQIILRLVKGAYWDAEIKTAQEQGLSDYPVFTRKQATDVSYLACVNKMITYGTLFYPQFATHNAYTVASVMSLMRDKSIPFEFQCLHGMGQSLYDEVMPDTGVACRIYAPVGSHEELLAYLVRRLLENGANSSFVNQIADNTVDISTLLIDPFMAISAVDFTPHPAIPLPADIYPHHRKNAQGLDMTDHDTLANLQAQLMAARDNLFTGSAIVNGERIGSSQIEIKNPADTTQCVGMAQVATDGQIQEALRIAHEAYFDWDRTPVAIRAACLDKAADLLTERTAYYLALLIREAGKTVEDAIADLREAIDFCRYYAEQARFNLAAPLVLKGVTGESNHLEMHGRGVFVCISPWNFPLAIFMGQVTAALVAGNTVIAKPAEQTPLIATYAVALLHEAGIPPSVLHLLPGEGERVGAALVADVRTQGVMFTGSTETARLINLALASRQGPIIPLIAETGGQNAMIVDSSALVEQVVSDVILSAFGSAGQRCSALRVLFVQEDIADKVIHMLSGAMAELTVGDPSLLSTDIGPVIDKEAQGLLEAHLKRMHAEGKLIYQTPLSAEQALKGTFFAPCAFEISDLTVLKKEIFGPFLHVIRFKAADLDQVIQAINLTGYGLTLGIHSRIETTINYIHKHTRVGNTYVNRGMTGAVVGVQPFGGEGLSGTGPKAGGPHYLMRLCTERTMTVNTTAAGGNASLMSLSE